MSDQGYPSNTAGAPGPPMGYQPQPVKQGMPGWAIALIVVGIVGVVLVILAAIAIPAFQKYRYRSRTTEAPPNLKKIFDGAKGYFETGAVVSRSGVVNPLVFPDPAGLTPVKPCCKQKGNRCRNTDWSQPTWRAIGFEISDPHYFQYRFDSSGSGQTAHFTAGAHADLDCDGAFSTFERGATVDTENRVVGAASLYVKDDIE